MSMTTYTIRKVMAMFGEVEIIVRNDDAQIPVDEQNSDYQRYLQWLADGNTPEIESA